MRSTQSCLLCAARPGDLVHLTARLQTAGERLAGHVMRVTASAPGRADPFFPFKRVQRLPAGGTLDVPLRLAYRDPPGEWRFTVTDVSTGASATAALTVKGEAQ